MIANATHPQKLIILAILGAAIWHCGGGSSGSLAANAKCERSTECLSGVCVAQVCARNPGLDNGYSCQTHAECKSLLCIGGRCTPGNQLADTECRYGEACRSGRCEANRCAARCGDALREGAEDCDGADLGTGTCASLGFDSGTVDCNADCSYNTSECVKHQWVQIEAGSFVMGSARTEPDRSSNETQHTVTLTHGFEIASSETTQRDFLRVRRYNPSLSAEQAQCVDGKCPVEQLNWSEAAAYCNKLSADQGLAQCYSCQSAGKTIRCVTAASYLGSKIYDCKGYRLPTEAEWEYAYRAGTTTPYPANADELGWTEENAAGGPRPVQQKQPNAWGLYDLGGNVWEWCHDGYLDDLGSAPVTDPLGPDDGRYRVTRGGSWNFARFRMRSAGRLFNAPDKRYFDLGFRCARTR